MSDDPYGLRSLDVAELRGRDGAKWGARPVDYAAWVADMDFGVAPPVAEALHGLIARHEFGYPNWGGPYALSPAGRQFVTRMTERFGWTPDIEEVMDLIDVLQGVRAAVYHRSSPGDGVVLHMPAYFPFIDTIGSMERRLVDVTWTADGFDYDDLEDRLAREGARVWILCHPHNPLGHVFERAELEHIAEIAMRHDLLVIADEVHADLCMPGVDHLPFAAVDAELERRTVTVTSASKAFNLAGLRWAVMHVGDTGLRDALGRLPGHYLGAPNRMGVAAALAAWTECDDWLRDVVTVIDENRHALVTLLDRHLPGVEYRPPLATYLAWLDCRALGFADEPVEVFRERGVELSPGLQFGPTGAGHVRVNLATSPSVLSDMVAAMAD